MKKITLLLLLLFISFKGYSQLPTEGFENTTGVPGPIPAYWNLGTGNWAVFETQSNGFASIENWGINPFASGLQLEGTQCASVGREETEPGNISEDYLATPAVAIAQGGTTELHFWTRNVISGNQGTTFKVMAAFADDPDNQLNPIRYTEIAVWTEANLILPTTNFNVWTEKTVPIPDNYKGHSIYIAFVRVYEQTDSAVGGDFWLIDKVGVDAQCVPPTTKATNGITQNNAVLNWTNPSGATLWEIELIPATGAFTGTPNYINVVTGSGTPVSFTIPPLSLQSNTTYKYRVRGICSPSSFTSEWSTASANFTTLVAPPICGGNLVDSGGINGNYGINENSTVTVTPLAGQVASIVFTSFNTQAGSDILRVYDGPNATFPLLAALSGTTLPPSFTSTAPNGELTFVFTSNGSVNNAGYVGNISCGPAPVCRIPTQVTVASPTTTQLTVSWVQPTNADSSIATTWDIIALPCGSPAPTTTSQPNFNGNDVAPTGSPLTFTLEGLTPAMCYDIYVRAVCGTTNSAWSTLPATLSTLVAPAICGGNFVDTGGVTGNYGNSQNLTTTICPTTPGNGDAVTVIFRAFNTQANADFLKVYDGDNASATLLANLSGTTLPPSFTSSAPSGCLTFVFTSNAATNAPGWLADVVCAPQPACAAPTALSASGTTYNSTNLTWTQPANPNGTTPNVWDIIALPCNSPAPSDTDQGNFNGNNITATGSPLTFNLNGLASLTCYDIYVRAECGSAWSLPVRINTPVAPPICGGNFLDPGTTGDYGNNLNSVVTICPNNPATELVTVTFTSFDTEATFDGLYVFDGNSVNAPQIPSANGAGTVPGGLAGSFWGTAIPGPFTSSSADGCLTFRFVTDGSGQESGWTSNITCNPAPACRKPAGLTIPATTVTHNSAIINWTQPANPDASIASEWQVLALTCGTPPPGAVPPTTGILLTVNAATPAPPYTLLGLDPETCYDIYVRAVCSTSLNSDWSGPRRITTKIAPPVCGGIFVDAGGSNGDYPAGVTDVTTVICPTLPTDVVTVTFSMFNTEGTYDGLYVFDGNSITAPMIPSANAGGNVPGGVAGSFWGELTGANLPGPFTSTSNDGCLTFRFRTDGGGVRPGWRANVTCSPAPNCRRPFALTATQITSTSAYFGWTEPTAGVEQWEVLYVLAGTPGPLPTTPGNAIVSINQPLFTGLLPGTRYTYYVRSFCPNGGTSAWSIGYTFTTLIINDNCSGAIFAPVNQSALCQQVTPGTLTLATPSTPAPTAPCQGGADDDVWFQFVASNPYLTVSLLNIVGTTTNLNFGVYSGACGTLNQIFCSSANATSGVVNGLTIGQTYYVRVYSNGTAAQTVNFNLCISTPSSCITGQAACQNLVYENIQGVIGQPAIGCLLDPRNPTYYTINVSETGPINLLLTQSTTQGGAPNLDVDYAAWGPFTSQEAACTAIGNPPTRPPGIGVPVTQTTGCSFSIAATETLNIANAVEGQVYVILITNYADRPGFISLTQTNVGAAGAGEYECCPDAYFTYNPVSYCKAPGTPNPVPTINQGSVAGVFSLSPASQPGLVFANTATGEIDLNASAPGNYLVLNTVIATASCSQKQRGYNISIVAPTTATINYDAPTYCASNTTVQAVTQTGDAGGVYSALPNGGLYINVATGAINPSLSAPGVYTVSYAIPGTGVCTLGNPSTRVEILPVPTIVQPAPVVICDKYTLPALTVGDYFSQTGGVGPIDPSIDITTSQTVFIYAMGANGCANEKSFTITINKVPTPTYTSTLSSCTSPDGSITVLTPTGSTAAVPANLFISEVTDANTGSLTYVEIFNGTGAPVNLANYKLKFYTWGSPAVTENLQCDLQLAGTIANNTTNVIKVSSAANITGVVPNQTFAGCAGVNNNDNIRLTTTSGTVIDLWGPTDGSIFTPGGQNGYTYRRLNTATLPSATFNPADWTAIDPEDYTNVGSYAMPTSTYEYSIDNGVTFQPGTAFNNLAPGTYTLVVRDIVTGCLSEPIVININANGATTPVNTISYTTPVCQLSTTNPLPDTSAPGFTTGGTYAVEPPTTTGITVDINTGEIDLATTLPGSYTIRYSTGFDAGTCRSAGFYDTPIVITAAAPAEVGFSYTTPICPIAQATLSPTLASGFVLGGTFAISPSTATIDPATGVITLGATVTPDTYTVTYSIGSDLNTCRSATSNPGVQVIISPVNNANTTFTYTTPVCAIAQTTITPLLDPAITPGGVFAISPSQGVVFDPATGVITLAGTTAGSYNVTYTVAQNLANCQPQAVSAQVPVVINAAVIPVVGFNYDTPVCAGETVNPMPNLDAGFVTGGTFGPAGIVNAATGEINLSALTAGQVYTITYNLPANIASCQDVGNSSATITKIAPIVIDLQGGCENVYVLNANPVNGSFNPETATFQWNNASGPILIGGDGPSLNVPAAGTYTVVVTVDGCSTESAPFVVSSIACTIQKGISVNNDGLNDTFDLTGYDVKKLSIFNRLGMEVYSRANYVNEWGGKSDKGDELPDGTYFYVIDRIVGDSITGWIYINRAQ